MNLCDNLARPIQQTRQPIFQNTLSRELTTENQGPIRTMAPAESARLQKELDHSFVLTNSVTIPLSGSKLSHLQNNSMKYSMLTPRKLMGEFERPAIGSHEIFSPDALVETLQLFSDYLPEKLRSQLQNIGVEVALIGRKLLNLPEYSKSIKNCDYVLDLFKKDEAFPQKTSKTQKNVINTIDKTEISRQIFEFEKSKADKSNMPSLIEKFYQFRLATDLRSINNHFLTTTLMDVGINGIRIAGNSAFITFDPKIKGVMKLSVKAGTLALEFYDKVRKSDLFRIDDPKYNDLTPRERYNFDKLQMRRDELVNKNVGIISPMLKWLKNDSVEHFDKNSIVRSLLKGFRADPDEVLLKMNKKENINDFLSKKMIELYKV